MLAALLYGKEDLRLETVEDPTPGVGEVVIEVGAATTCGTDLKAWRRGGHAKMLKLPTLFGHEAAGRIVAIDASVINWRIGDRVVANNSAPCLTCFFCKRQKFSLCNDLSFNNGTFAEYLRIPSAIVQQNLLPIPDHLSDAIAAMTEPLACVLHGIARSNYKVGDRVVLLGDGAIGLMFAAVVAPKTEFYVFGGSESRLEIAKKFGAAKTFNHRDVADVPELVKTLTDGWGADVVIEATGTPIAWETAIACACPGATVNLFGGCPRDTTISVNTEQLHYNELTLKGVFHNTPEFVRSALELLASETVPFELLISDRQPLQNLEQVFQDMKQRKSIKVAIEPKKNER